MTGFLAEYKVQNLIQDNLIVKEGIKSLLGFDCELEFIKEDSYINGITADFTVINNNEIIAIIECKAGNINLTEYVRGIGQLYQYEYFAENNIPHKSYDYNETVKIIYFYPSSVIRNNNFNIAKFKYPDSSVIYELNESTYAIREITAKDLKDLSIIDNDNLVAISQYYFRDNRIFEYYILIKYLLFLEVIGVNEIKRADSENFLKKTETINNGNWRNAFITVSNLGLIKGNNFLTEAGKKLAICDYETFALILYHSYIEPYFTEIEKCFGENTEVNMSNSDFISIIRENNQNRDVLYLTESDNRYISSWLNIMRDDYGIISYEPRHKKRKINYKISELNDETIKKKIKENSIAYEYIKNFHKLFKELLNGGTI